MMKMRLMSIFVRPMAFRRCCSSVATPISDPQGQLPPEVMELLAKEAQDKNIKKTKKKKVNRVKMNPFDSSKRLIANLDPEEAKAIKKEMLKPSLRYLKRIEPPEDITENLNKMLSGEFMEIGEQMEQYLAAGVNLRRFIASRRVPAEGRYLKQAWDTIEEQVRDKYKEELDKIQEENYIDDEVNLEAKIQQETKQIYERKCVKSTWVPIDYDDDQAAWAYLMGKGAFDYSVVKTILSEVRARTRSEKFQPRTLLDFGSGVGTCYWAMRETFGQITEYVSIDTSHEMTDLCRTIISGGKTKVQPPAGHYFRTGLSLDSDIKYDIVTCAFALLDLSSENERAGLLQQLWGRTQDFLIVAEVGTNAGFQVIMEARHCLTRICNEENAEVANEANIGHLFSPCPHQLGCPRYEQDTVPCNFDLKYTNFKLQTVPASVRDLTLVDRYSYVVFRKGRRSDKTWPRLVQEPIRNKNHVICRLCTEKGELRETLVRKKSEGDEKTLHKYAKYSFCGKQMKVNLSEK